MFYESDLRHNIYPVIDKVLDRLVKKNYPQMYEKWKQDYPSPKSV